LLAFVKLEMLKVRTKKNHYELKAQLYFSALQYAFQELRRLKEDNYNAFYALIPQGDGYE
jgi:23S rRNA G2069 N7-methylase RlmK/C1962 C5-methylase RlmI